MSEAPSNGDGRAPRRSGRRVEDVDDQLERYRPQLERSFPLDEGAAAQGALATNAHVVKLVLVP